VVRAVKRRSKRATRVVWFLAPPGAELLDIAGPWEVLGHANDALGYAAYEPALLGPSRAPIRTRHGLVAGDVRPLPARPVRFPDVAIVAGGAPLGAAEPVLAAWLRRHASRVPVVVSICTGAFLLGEAGLLDGRRATTHWRYLDALRTRYPAARVVDDGIFVRDGRVWTSAGITAGIDLALALVEDHHGRAIAMEVARELVLFLRRSGHQAQFSGALRRQEAEPARLRDLIAFVLEHVDEPLPLERLAGAVGTSPRSLTRWCRLTLDESPAQLVRRLRIDEARRLLESTALPLKAISVRAGLGDASTLWRAFTQRLGVTPAAYRERFAATATAPGSRRAW
jgi:transcriptional regulator GlxA family with amidase domain